MKKGAALRFCRAFKKSGAAFIVEVAPFIPPTMTKELNGTIYDTERDTAICCGRTDLTTVATLYRNEDGYFYLYNEQLYVHRTAWITPITIDKAQDFVYEHASSAYFDIFFY